MPVLHVAFLAALRGLAEALAVSPSGQETAARMWLDPGASVVTGGGLGPILGLGTALGLLVVARRRLSAAVGDGVRAIVRPGLFRASPGAHDALAVVIGAAASLLVSRVTLPRVEMWASSPTATGVGLVITGLALASTRLAPPPPGPLRTRGVRPGPSLVGAALVGVAHGLAVFPGASRVGAALTVLLWIGVRPARAVDLAFLLTASSLVAALARGPLGGVDAGTLLLGALVAFVGVVASAGMLRSLVEGRRLGLLALWTIPLGLGMLAYAHALPRAI